MRIQLLVADITTLAVDAIVNAANPALAGGGGVDGAIHRAAGPALAAACRALPTVDGSTRCPPGEARITPGFDLPARWVIHAVGPVWHGGGEGEARTLRRCYQASLHLAQAHGVRSLAFPAISCGIYGYPHAAAARIAVDAVQDFAAAHAQPERIVLCCFGAAMAAHHAEALRGPRDAG